MSTVAPHIGTLVIDGREYVVIPKDEYLQAFDEHGVRVLGEDEMTDQDWGDVAEMERRKAEGGEPIPFDEIRKDLGL